MYNDKYLFNFKVPEISCRELKIPCNEQNTTCQNNVNNSPQDAKIQPITKLRLFINTETDIESQFVSL